MERPQLEESVKERHLPDQERNWVAKIGNLNKLHDLVKIDLAGNAPTHRRKGNNGEIFRNMARSAPMMATAASKSVDDFLAVRRQGEEGELIFVVMAEYASSEKYEAAWDEREGKRKKKGWKTNKTTAHKIGLLTHAFGNGALLTLPDGKLSCCHQEMLLCTD